MDQGRVVIATSVHAGQKPLLAIDGKKNSIDSGAINLHQTGHGACWRDGTKHIKMSPLEFMQRLAALVPRPRMGCARLLKRVFDIDLEHCPQCGGDLKIIAAIEEPAVTACRAGDRVADGEKGYLISYSIFD